MHEQPSNIVPTGQGMILLFASVLLYRVRSPATGNRGHTANK